ncbi:uncharacterized protein LOC134395583 [Elgaria multicarinata webbii]|uniref:uncharacterized protein LOC134395583 n=1 Tax=Elgaria multicarinata webbii TaxID=159646 RepID=UPI002FCCC42A
MDAQRAMLLLKMYLLLIGVVLQNILNLCQWYQQQCAGGGREWVSGRLRRAQCARRRQEYLRALARESLGRLHRLQAARRARAAALIALRARRMRPRRCWVFPKPEQWYDDFVLGVWDDERWIRNFRMTRATLFEIAEQLRPHLERQRTIMRKPLPPHKRLAITIWWLSSLETYREAANHFGVGESTVSTVVMEVCLTIKLVLLRKTVFLGDHEKIMDGFLAMGMPRCVGVLGGCHIPIHALKGQGLDSTNRISFYSMLLQGTTDHRGRFIDIEIGWTAKNRDAFIFHSSALCQAMDAGVFVPGNPTVLINNVLVPPLILADSDYPMRRWLIKPYKGRLDQRKTAFNERFNRCHDVVEQAFSRLKARWRCLTARLPLRQENIVPVITACVVLHNICETKGHDLLEGNEETGPLLLPDAADEYKQGDDHHFREGKEVRNALAHYFFRNPNV